MNEKGGSGRPGCGCLVLILLVLLLVLVVVGPFAVLQRFGLRESAAEGLLSGPPHREAAQLLVLELEEAGMYTKGIELYVLPIMGTGGNLAYAVLDASKGFGFEPSSDPDVVVSYLKKLATGEAADQFVIRRVAIDYRGQGGEPLLTVTAPTDSIRSYARGKISREEFMRAVDANTDIPQLLLEVLQ